MPQYRTPFFARLIELGIEDSVIYKVYAGNPAIDAAGRDDGESESTIFENVKTNEYRLGKRSLLKHKVGPGWDQADLVIVEHGIRNLVTYKWLFFRRPSRIAFWGHGKTYTKHKTKFEEGLKSYLVNNTDWFFAYTLGGVESVVRKGFPRERTTNVINSTDTKELKNQICLTTPLEVSKFQTKHLITNCMVGVFIGALDQSKRLGFLVAAAELIHHALPNFRLLVFGAGPELKFIQDAAQKYSFIQYCGRADIKTQALVAHTADLILMPGRVGLIAVDSFAMGLPIVTTNWPWHAPEFEYLEHGVTAILSNDDIHDYARRVILLLSNKTQLETMKAACREQTNLYCIENMAKRFHEGVLLALNSKNIKEYEIEQ